MNTIWMLICAFLVIFMQAGFAMMTTGFTRAKNAGHTMAMNMMVFVFAVLGYWIIGHGLRTGGTLFFFSGAASGGAALVLFLSSVVYLNIAAVIPIGAMAERWAFKSFMVYAFFVSIVVYPLYANWVWNGGWLSRLGSNFGLGHGVLDFSGSSVVHMLGGITGLAGAIVLGPRTGKYRADGTPVAIPGHHIPMAIIGCLVLFFGWFGFNAGSFVTGDLSRAGIIAVNTLLASAAAAFSSLLFMWMKYGKPDLSLSANGLLGGLVAISAPCAFVSPAGAVAIGLVAGVLCCVSVFFVERNLKVDDPAGSVSVHGTCGAWGMIALGLFADGSYGEGLNGIPGTVKGLFSGGGWPQLGAQLLGVIVSFVFVFAVMYVFFAMLNRLIPVRVSPEAEFEGLDQSEVAVTAYPDFSITKRR